MDLFKPAKLLTLEAAKTAGEAIIAHGAKNNWLIATVIVDVSGYPVYSARMTGTILASYDGALMKAGSALKFARPTSALEAAVAAGKPHYFAFEGALPVAGGVPIVVDGEIIGGIGVGGGPGGPEAVACAEAGLAAIGLKA